MTLRLSTVILPVDRWHEGGREKWQRAEELGFDMAYTYDHLSWRPPFHEGTWFGALPTLTAAATVTERLRLGTLVSSPNFRHPVTFAKELLSLDDISGGRITLGIGAGTMGADATVLGQEPWTAKERADRFEEFVPLLDRLLTQDVTTQQGTYYAAHEARTIPGCVQRPRVPFAVAATGPRGMRLTARLGQAWVTTGDVRIRDTATPAESIAAIGRQVGRLSEACAQEGRDPAEVTKIVLTGHNAERPLDSVDAFVDCAGAYAEQGIDEIALHWPIPGTFCDADQRTFEKIATAGLAQLNSPT